MGGLFQINPIWNLGPYNPAKVSAGSQPDWYMAVFDGAVRLWPSWEMYLFGRYTIPAIFFPAVIGMGILTTLLALYPLIERKLTGDDAHHNLLQRPRDVPVRTATGHDGHGLLLLAGRGVRQRHHRLHVRHLPERDDVDRAHRAARAPAARLLR